MPNSKRTKCSICGQPIKTVMGAVAMQQAPLVCRRCFGQETYSGPAEWGRATIAPEHATPDGIG